MDIVAGVLLIIVGLETFISLGIDIEYVILVHIGKLIIGVVAIVIMFNIGVPLWMPIVSIASVACGFIGGFCCVEDFMDGPTGVILILIGVVGVLAVGVALFF